MSFKTYDPKKLKITLGPDPTGAIGIHVVTGFAKDTFVKIGRISDSVLSEVGASGEVARALNADHRGAMELTLIQTSLTNDFLSLMLALDENTGAGAVPLLVKDLRGNTVYAAKNCWIKKPADSEFAQAIQSRAWSFETDELEVFVGGEAAQN